MKQKYTIVNEKDSGKLLIQEYAELDKDLFSLVCEETYDSKDIKSAVSDGKLKLISKLRTPNLYPIAEYADKIADAVMGFFDKKADVDSPVELIFDDIRVMKQEDKISNKEDGEDEPSGEVIDDLLDEDDDLDDISDSDDTEEDGGLDMPHEEDEE